MIFVEVSEEQLLKVPSVNIFENVTFEEVGPSKPHFDEFVTSANIAVFEILTLEALEKVPPWLAPAITPYTLAKIAE